MGASSSRPTDPTDRCVLDRQFVLLYVYVDHGLRKVAVLPRVCPLYGAVCGLAIDGPSSLRDAVKASDGRYLAIALEQEENLVEVAQDGAVLTPFALARLIQTATTVYVQDVTRWAIARDHELVGNATADELPSVALAGEARTLFPEAGILKMHL
jgi:hypothetical protein